MKVLVTGGAGFIGYHLIEAINKSGNEAIGIDNMVSTYYDPTLKYARYLALGNGVKEMDLLDYGPLATFMMKERFDAIVHLAANASIPYSRRHGRTCMYNDVVGFNNLLEAARESGTKKVIFPRTTANPVQSIYGISKHVNEEMAKGYARLCDLSIVGLRFCTVYGEMGRPDMAVWKFMRAAISGETVQLYNEGRMARDFTHVEDVVSGIYRVLDAEVSGYSKWDVGTGKSIPLVELVNGVELVTGRKVKIEHVEMPHGYDQYTALDVKPFMKKFGYAPKIMIMDGLKRFYDWYVNYKKELA